MANDAQLIADLKAALAKADAELVAVTQDIKAVQAAIDQAQAIADQLGGTVALEGPASAAVKGSDIVVVGRPPDLILERKNVTTPEELANGAAREWVTITGVLRPPAAADGKWRKPVGADATAGKHGGICVELSDKGQFRTWVDDGGGLRMSPDFAIPGGIRSFFAYRVSADKAKTWLADLIPQTIALPNGRKPCDGIAAIGKGVYRHAFCDPIDQPPPAEIIRVRFYRTERTDAEIEADRAEWAAAGLIDHAASMVALDSALVKSTAAAIGVPGPVPPDDYVLEPPDPSATSIGIAVDDQPRPPFIAWGWGVGSPADQASGTADRVKQWANELIGMLNTGIVRINSPSLANKPVVRVCLDNGVKMVHCTYYRFDPTRGVEAQATQLVNDVQAAIDGGMPITSISPAGEPGPANEGGQSPNWPKGSFAPSMKAIRAELNRRGFETMQLVPPEFANWDSIAHGCYDELMNANALATCVAGAGHSYNNCPTIESTDKRWMSDYCKLGIWQLELGDMNVPYLGARAVHNVGRGVTVEVAHQGVAEKEPEPSRDTSQKLMRANGQPNPWYWTWQVLATRWLNGTRARGFVTDHPIDQGIDRDTARFLIWSYGRKPRMTFACGQRADGNWVVAAQNYTFGSGGGSALSSNYAAQKVQPTVTIQELRGWNLPWAGFRVNTNGGVTETESAMVDGQLRFKALEPGEMAVLVSG